MKNETLITVRNYWKSDLKVNVKVNNYCGGTEICKKEDWKRSSPKSHFLWVTLSFLSVGSNLKIKKKHNFNPIKQIFKNWPGIVFLKYSIIEHVIKKSNFMVHIILLFAQKVQKMLNVNSYGFDPPALNRRNI